MTQEMKLLKAAMDGNTAAFEQIVQKYQSLVCAITFSGTGRVDISEELAQETFLSAWKNLRQLKELSGFRPWLCTIARNMLNSYYRKKKTIPLDPADIADLSDQTQNPSDNLISQEENAMLQQALMQIPAEYREPMVMYYRQEKSTKEVAIGLGLKESTVRMRLHRARQMLREEIAARLERTLERTAPDKTFTKAVMAGIGAGLAAGAAGTASAATAATGAAGAGTGASTGIAAAMSTVTAKIITAAAVAAIAVGGVFVYKHLSQPDHPPVPSDEIAVVQTEQKPAVTPENTEITPSATQNVVINPIEVPKLQTAAVPTNVDTADTPNTEPASIALTTEVPENTEYVFEPKGVLSGLITATETGEPVTDATVTISPGRLYRAKTDENGFYSFDKIDKNGDYSIGVYSKEYVGLTDYNVHPKMHLKKNSQSVKHFQLPKACMIDLYVIDEEGNPVKDTRVWVTSLASEHGREVGKSYASQRTDEDGYILLGGFAPSDKPYVITSTRYIKGGWVKMYGQKVRESVLDFAPGHLKVTLQDPDVIEYGEIVLQKGTQVQGIAKYSDGTPAKECKIVPYPEWWHSTTVPPGYKIDPNGFFTLSHIAPGSYRIQASIPMGESSSRGITLFSAQLPLEKDRLLEVTIPRKPTTDGSSKRDKIVEAKLHGIITDALTGKPIPTFRLRYQRVSGNHYGSDGKWVQFNNNKGDFTLNVTGNDHAVCKVQAIAEGYAPQWSEEINTKDNRAVLIKLAPGSSITGTVVDVKGKPVANAKILPYSLAGAARNHQEPIFVSEEGAVMTDENGLFVLKNIAVGIETLKITHSDYAYTIIPEIKVEEAKAVDLGKIVLGKGGIVEGVLYDNQGKPQSDVTLFAQNHYGFSSSDVQHGSVITDPNGFFRFENLPSEMCYIVRPRSYQHTGVVSCAIIPTDNKVTRLGFGGSPVIRGQLVIGGKPLKNTRLILTLGKSTAGGLFRSHADTDDNGRFEILAGLPGTYTLVYNQKSETFTSNYIKVLDVAIGTKDMDLGILPSQKRILQVNIQASDEQREQMRYFYVRQEDPMEGECIFWQEDLKQSKGSYTVNLPGPGLYYAIIHCGGNVARMYQYPIEITEDQNSTDIQVPFDIGPVTLTGILPEKINHVWFTNQDQSVAGILYAKKDDRNFRVEGLFPGTYYLSPKSANYQDSIEVTIPNVQEYTLNLDLAVLQEKLRERVSVHVFDHNGRPTENATVWVESNGANLLPASQDNCSSVFYLPGGEHIIHAEKDGIKATKVYRLNIDKNNTASGESYETFIQLGKGIKDAN
jgi:RNA polymerase sigma factor (sigma-70 family)